MANDNHPHSGAGAGSGSGSEQTWTEGGPAFKPGTQHPDEWRRDLNPDAMAGQNVGVPEGDHLQFFTAYDDKALHNRWKALPDDVLRNLVLLPRGARLKQGAAYFDLAQPERGVFTAMGNESVEPGQRLIDKTDVGYDTWNLVTGVEHPLGRDERIVDPQGFDNLDHRAA